MMIVVAWFSLKSVMALEWRRVSRPHRSPIRVGSGTAGGVSGWRCGARGAGAGSTSRTGSCAASSATAAGPAELHRRAAARHAAAGQGGGGAAVPERAVDEPHRPELLGASTPSVQAWIERFAEVYARKPEPEGRAVVVELDEMWHFLKKGRTSSGSGRLGIVLRDASSTGSWGVVTPPPSNECRNA